jgi:hypothetical protein
MDTKRPSESIPLGRFALCCRDVRWLACLEMLLFGTDPIRKPLLYPSELRGHGAATLVHRFNLRETALALP